MRNYPIKILVSAFLSISAWSFVQGQTETIKIAISKTNDSYSSWIERNGENTEWINLYSLSIDSALKMINTCDGLLVTGGEDVYPDYYGNISDTSRCGAIDHYRDSLEFALIDFALNTKMPIFGVCRGHQILNVALGGTLIIDIPVDFDTSVIHRQNNWKNCYHEVDIVPNSNLYSVSSVTSEIVNSNHHQGIDITGQGLMISSYSKDSLPESIEWVDSKDKGFLMAVQWHPERMEIDHPLSRNLAVEFLNESAKYHKNRN